MLIKTQNIFIISLFVAIFAGANFSFAANSDNISNNDIVSEIERNLIFSNDGRSQNQIAQDQLNQKDDFILVAGGKDASENEALNFKVTETKQTINVDARTKEKVAYNATLNGQYEVAIELYKQVLKMEPDNSYAMFSLGVLYQKLGQYRQAKIIYYKLLQNNPSNKEEIIGNILSTMLQESPRDALYLLTRLANSNPQSSYILVQTAFAFETVKNYDKAAEFLQKAVALSPERVDYLYNLAVMYDKAQNYTKSLETYNEVVRNYQDNKWAASVPLQAVQLRIESLKNKI